MSLIEKNEVLALIDEIINRDYLTAMARLYLLRSEVYELPPRYSEIVQCKDCKHLKTMCEDEGTCYYWCKHWNNATDDWGHCYCGERREP